MSLKATQARVTLHLIYSGPHKHKQKEGHVKAMNDNETTFTL